MSTLSPDPMASGGSQSALTQALEPLMADIYEAVGVRVSFSDINENTLAQTDYQCDFCRQATSNPVMLAKCQACNREAKRRAKARGGTYFYRCWRGLISAVIHVADQEESLGFFIISGFISTPDRMAQTDQIFPVPEMQIQLEEMKSVQFLHFEKVQDIIKTVGIAGGYLVEAHRRHAAEDAQHQAEYRALQSQISPHFLFNTLNSISQMAVLEGAEQAPEAIYSLANLLRRSMKQSTGLIPLDEELSFVREYMRIKQLLGRENIHYQEELEPGTENLLLPAFSIQPLVENAVNHGLVSLVRGGTVSVTASREGDRVLLCVTDDGIGFDPEKIKPQSGGELSGIGVSNVLDRLRLFFGPRFENDVCSAPGQGTTILFRIPVTTL